MRMWSALLVVGIVATLCRSGEGTTTWRPSPYYEYEEQGTSNRATAGTSHNEDLDITEEPGRTVIHDRSGKTAHASASSETDHEQIVATGPQRLIEGGHSGKKVGRPGKKGGPIIKKGGPIIKKGGHSGPKEVYSEHNQSYGPGKSSGKDQIPRRGQYIQQEYSYPKRGYTGSYLEETSGHSTRNNDDHIVRSYHDQHGDEQNRGAYSLNHKESQVDNRNSRVRSWEDGSGVPVYGHGGPVGQYYHVPRQEYHQYESSNNEVDAVAAQNTWEYKNSHGSGQGQQGSAGAKTKTSKEHGLYNRKYY